MTPKMRQKLRSTYINSFISNRRKRNSRKRLCGASRLDMLFRTRKKLNILISPGTGKIRLKLKIP